MGREGLDMERWQIETAERLARIERSVQYIEAHLAKLPEDVEKHEARLTKLEGFIHTRAAYISGIAAAAITIIPYAYEWLKQFARGTS